MRTQTFTQLGGFTPGVRFWEDAELWIKVALAGYPIACSPTCCAMYDTNVSGQTTRPKSSPFGIGVHNLLLAKELDAHRNDPSFMRYYKKIGHYELCWLCTLFGTQELQRFSDVMHLRSVMPFKVSFYLFISKHPPITKTLKTCILWLRKLKDLASVIRHRILN
jgi:GT2 family glycosyltransferase